MKHIDVIICLSWRSVPVFSEGKLDVDRYLHSPIGFYIILKILTILPNIFNSEPKNYNVDFLFIIDGRAIFLNCEFFSK